MNKNYSLSKILLPLCLFIFCKSNSQEYQETVGLIASFSSGVLVPFLAKDIEKSIAPYLSPCIEKIFGSSAKYVITKPDELGISRLLEKKFILKLLIMISLNQVSKYLCVNHTSMLIKSSIVGCIFGYIIKNFYLKFYSV